MCIFFHFTPKWVRRCACPCISFCVRIIDDTSTLENLFRRHSSEKSKSTHSRLDAHGTFSANKYLSWIAYPQFYLMFAMQWVMHTNTYTPRSRDASVHVACHTDRHTLFAGKELVYVDLVVWSCNTVALYLLRMSSIYSHWHSLAFWSSKVKSGKERKLFLLSLQRIW